MVCCVPQAVRRMGILLYLQTCSIMGQLLPASGLLALVRLLVAPMRLLRAPNIALAPTSEVQVLGLGGLLSG